MPTPHTEQDTVFLASGLLNRVNRHRGLEAKEAQDDATVEHDAHDADEQCPLIGPIYCHLRQTPPLGFKLYTAPRLHYPDNDEIACAMLRTFMDCLEGRNLFINDLLETQYMPTMTAAKAQVYQIFKAAEHKSLLVFLRDPLTRTLVDNPVILPSGMVVGASVREALLNYSWRLRFQSHGYDPFNGVHIPLRPVPCWRTRELFAWFEKLGIQEVLRDHIFQHKPLRWEPAYTAAIQERLLSDVRKGGSLKARK